MIEIETDRCTQCGWCVDECPARIIEAGPPGGAPPAMQAELQDQCTLCGHCVAICPVGALSHHGLPAEGFEERARAIAPDAMRDFLLLRRSTRSFREEGVPREIMERLIEAGTHAGTASNAQTEGFIIVGDRVLLAELEALVLGIMWKKLRPLGNPVGRKLARLRYGDAVVDRSMRYHERFREAQRKGHPGGLVLRNAPALIAVHGERSNRSVQNNCAIAVRNMEMMAQSLDLGTCWAGFLLIAAGFSKKIARRLGLSDDRNVYSAIMVGYPRHRYARTVPRKEREVRWL
jgi:nitroreductase/NAD-dependent dihydropyrimidine dehydrogenase PreA subunit